jgi:hypothetical protein
MLAKSQYQPRLSSITNVALGGSTNQIAVFTLILIINICIVFMIIKCLDDLDRYR